MKNIYIFFAILIIWGSQIHPVLGQVDARIEGYWSGVLTQNEGGFSPDYIFEMRIETDGDQVSGTATVSTTDSLTATMAFEGKIYNNGYLNLKETHVLEGTKMVTLEWCLKQFSLYLRHKDNEFYLVGYWTGISRTSICVPGKIKLRRRGDRV